MYFTNLSGPSGVALGGIGVGYYEIDPTGRVTRNCINNIHKSFADSPAGFMVGAWDGKTATRLQRDDAVLYGMKGYANSDYMGLWPRVSINFRDSLSGVADIGFSAYSGLKAHDSKNSSLPVVYYDVTLKNDDNTLKTMSALLSWGDLIGRGIRDSEKKTLSDLNGESSDWFDMATLQTYAKGVKICSEGVTYSGVMQYAKESLPHHRATFQNYNNAFMILAEERQDTKITILKNFDVNDSKAFSSYTVSGCLSDYDEREVELSASAKAGRTTTNGSAVAVSAQVPAHSEVTVRFLVSWFMPEITESEYAKINHFSSCDYNKYYHNYFSSIEELTCYAIKVRNAQKDAILDWQRPILNSSMPKWLQFKIINSGYTLYACGVLNKRGNFSTLEGEMGGYGGTMDQKMSSYAVYDKLFPQLNLTENRQFANVTGANGEIQHFDVHYYFGICDYENTDNPTPAGSMIDNTGTWMMQMWNYYRHTGDKKYLEEYYQTMKTSLDFLISCYPEGAHIPSYYTTYDDYSHPDVLVYSGTVWLYMLELGVKWAVLLCDNEAAVKYEAERIEAHADLELYYGAWQQDLGFDSFYAYGSDGEFLASNGKQGMVENSIMFSGAMAGQFMSRMDGQGDKICFDKFISHMKTFLQTSVQGANDYMAAKIYNIRTSQSLDKLSSNCWPFYLESYGGMAAIQAGYLEDGLEILKHTSLVDLRLGYTWTRSLWTRAYVTYMTAPVSWMITDVLAGASVDVPTKSITLGPSAIASQGVGAGERLCVPLYYPKYWAELNYDKSRGELTYKVTKTFYEAGEKAIAIDTVFATPAGVTSGNTVKISLPDDFIIAEGAVLDLSAHIADFKGVLRDKLLGPVAEYERPKAEVAATGIGLEQTIFAAGNVISKSLCEKVDFHIDSDNPLSANIKGEYTLVLEGRILPRYSQNYQLLFEYIGSDDALTVWMGNQEITKYSSSLADVESQQFTPTEKCALRVITKELDGGKLYPIRITYRGNTENADGGILRFLWWSTTQQMGLVVKERMYPALRYSNWINGIEFYDSTAQIEGNHMAYTADNSYCLYKGIDFGKGANDFTFSIKAAAMRSDISKGGTMEIRRDNAEGELLGTLVFEPTSDCDWNQYSIFTTHIHSGLGLKGMQDICFVFRPTSKYLFNYTEFTFTD